MKKSSNQKNVNMKLLSCSFGLYSNPIILMINCKGGKRAESAQWAQEVQKMLKGIIKSIEMIETIMNQSIQNKKLFLENQELIISDEDKYWLLVYLIDNAILRIYACLDKISQMCRCYFEHKDNCGQIKIVAKCGCQYVMNENNCSFVKLLNYLNQTKNRDKLIIGELNNINNNKSIIELRKYRNMFTHRKHNIDRTTGLDPDIKSNYKNNGMVETIFSFGKELPSLNWFRVEIVNANNVIVECVEKIGQIIFPRDFKIKLDINKK